MNKYKNQITLKANENFQSVKIENSKDIDTYVRQFYFEDLEVFESIFIVLLDRAMNTIGWVKVGQGGVSACMTDIKIIAKYAIDNLASSVILVHNHPSGNLKPSIQDISLTNKVREGLKILDVSVLDHLIITKDAYYSFADEGKI